MGENPMLSDPDVNHVEQALSNLDFLVVQDIFLSETAALADVVLPAACFAEKTGTYSNTERRVQLARQGRRSPRARPCRLGDHPGHMHSLRAIPMHYADTAEIMAEINRVTPSYAGITYSRLRKDFGLQWPCPNEEHPGTTYLHKDKFSKGLGTFLPCDFKPMAEVPDERVRFHPHHRQDLLPVPHRDHDQADRPPREGGARKRSWRSTRRTRRSSGSGTTISLR